MTMIAERTMIDDLLEEQQRLTAVERFARQHDEARRPAQARYYHALIPLTRRSAASNMPSPWISIFARAARPA